MERRVLELVLPDLVVGGLAGQRPQAELDRTLTSIDPTFRSAVEMAVWLSFPEDIGEVGQRER